MSIVSEVGGIPKCATLLHGVPANKAAHEVRLRITVHRRLSMTGIQFFDLPIEIRLKIYSEILVQSATVVINTFKHTKIRVYAELLRVNKRVHSEASPLLYSKNRFEIHQLGGTVEVAQFLRQIGTRARFIRHVRIDFPKFRYNRCRATQIALSTRGRNELELIRDTFTSLTTLELYSIRGPLICDQLGLVCDLSIQTQALDLVEMHTKAIPSLKRVVVLMYVWHKKDQSAELMNRMHDYGWTVEFMDSGFKPPDVG
jgi:hypothetical protein